MQFNHTHAREEKKYRFCVAQDVFCSQIQLLQSRCTALQFVEVPPVTCSEGRQVRLKIKFMCILNCLFCDNFTILYFFYIFPFIFCTDLRVTRVSWSLFQQPLGQFIAGPQKDNNHPLSQLWTNSSTSVSVQFPPFLHWNTYQGQQRGWRDCHWFAERMIWLIHWSRNSYQVVQISSYAGESSYSALCGLKT